FEYRGGDPVVARRPDGEDELLSLEDDGRRDGAAVAREREARAVLRGIGAVRGELVVGEEAEPRGDVEIPAPRAECLRDGDGVAFVVGHSERRRALCVTV